MTSCYVCGNMKFRMRHSASTNWGYFVNSLCNTWIIYALVPEMLSKKNPTNY